MSAGIYRIVHVESDRCYIGQAVDIKRRWQKHRTELRSGVHHSRYLQNAWNKYGEDAFIFEVLEVVDIDSLDVATKRSTLTECEQRWFDKYEPDFNVAPAAGSPAGIQWTDETRARRSASMMGNTKGRANKGRTISPEWAQKIADHHRGKPLSEETKAKMSAAHKGKPKTEEHKARIGAAHKGRAKSPEHKAAISASLVARSARLASQANS